MVIPLAMPELLKSLHLQAGRSLQVLKQAITKLKSVVNQKNTVTYFEHPEMEQIVLYHVRQHVPMNSQAYHPCLHPKPVQLCNISSVPKMQNSTSWYGLRKRIPPFL